MRNCDDLRKVDDNKHCKHSFTLLVFEASDDIANNLTPGWKRSSWDTLKQIPGTKLWRASQTGDRDFIKKFMNVETYKFRPKKRGFYISLLDEGSCTLVVRIRITHVICRETIVNLAYFRNTSATSSDEITPPKIEGKCIKNALWLEDFPPTMYCSSKGTWYDIQSECICKTGFAMNDVGNECKSK